jgi:hypothetical protein
MFEVVFGIFGRLLSFMITSRSGSLFLWNLACNCDKYLEEKLMVHLSQSGWLGLVVDRNSGLTVK